MANRSEMYGFLLNNASSHTITELVQLIKQKFNKDIDKKRLAQYCLHNKIKYKFEKPNKSHSNKSTPNGTIVVKTDGNMLKIKTSEHKWEYLQRKIYENYYHVKLPDDKYVVFLDGNNRNFAIDNLKVVPRRNSAIMSKNGLFTNNAELTKLGILTAKLMIKTKNIESE